MRDKEKSIAAGMTDFKDEEAIENRCRSCHNEKSPTYKLFYFESMRQKVKYPIPAK
jgi:cell division protein FtsB